MVDFPASWGTPRRPVTLGRQMGFRVLRGRVSWVLQREALLLTQKLQLCVEAGTRRQEGLPEEEGELSPTELGSGPPSALEPSSASPYFRKFGLFPCPALSLLQRVWVNREHDMAPRPCPPCLKELR